MSYLNSNIRHLRKDRSLTQDALAQKIGIKRSLLGAYEEHRAEPRIATIQKLAYLFQLPLDALINQDLTKDGATVDTEGKTLRVLPVVVDEDNNEKVTLVPVQAEAGYADSYGDPEFIETLPSFSLPVRELYPDQSYRIFQINGDSMLPITSGSYVICTYLHNWTEIKDGKCYVVVTRDRGIVYKRLWNQLDTDGTLLLKSDNPVYAPYTLDTTQIVEIWQGLGFLSFELPDGATDGTSDVPQILNALNRLDMNVMGLRQQVDAIARE